MSEAIAEMVLPGTYIEVRSEGLIAVGSIATGNIGIVGTAQKGRVNTVVPLGSPAEVLDEFGPPDRFDAPLESSTALTLTRALQSVFAAGGRNVFAVRIANGTPSPAAADVQATGGVTAFTVTANSGGSWGNGISIVVIDQGATVTPRFRLTLTNGPTREVFEGNNVGEVRSAIAAGSSLVDVGATTVAGSNLLATAAPVSLSGGTSLPNVNSSQIASGLALLEDQPVNIVLVAGVGADVAAAPLASHVERTENDGRERIAVVGARSSGTATDVSAILLDTASIADDRVILVAPGFKVTDPASGNTVTLPPAYTSAMVAGKLATLAPHISLTNQSLPIAELAVNYTSAANQNLLQNRVLLVRRKFGQQIVKGITTDTGAFKQISVRRIVDYAKAGVRSGSDPYIGKLNNARVRAALKATLDGFLSQMILDEMLVGYELDVTATRAQEIQGICAVIMTLQPTFSIDFIRVTMTLS
jgi:hypothetical protein